MKLNQLIKSKDMTAYQVSKKSGLGQATISQIINKKRVNPAMETIVSIANALNVTVDEVCKSIKEM